MSTDLFLVVRTNQELPFFSAPVITPLAINRMSKQGDLILSLYNVNQQRLIDNGGSVVIGDRLYIEIKYRTSLTRNSHEQNLFHFHQ